MRYRKPRDWWAFTRGMAALAAILAPAVAIHLSPAPGEERYPAPDSPAFRAWVAGPER